MVSWQGRPHWIAAWVLAMAAATMTACGGGGGGGDAGADDYFPLAAGDRWLYAGATVRVDGTRVVDGDTATVVQVTDDNGEVIGETLYLRSTGALRQLVPEGAHPYTAAVGSLQLLRFPLVAGDSFVQVDKTVGAGIDLDGDGREERVAVRSVVTVHAFETVTVAAGRFEACAHVNTVITETLIFSAGAPRQTWTTDLHDWLAPGIGPVRSSVTTIFGGRSETANQGLEAYAVGGRRSEVEAPTVSAVEPASTGNATMAVSAFFSEPIDPTSITQDSLIVVDGGGRRVPGTVRADGLRLVFEPSTRWTSGDYSARIASTVTDRVGNALATPVEWNFAIDADSPAVTAVSPADGAVDIGFDAAVTLTFAEDIDVASAWSGSVTLRDVFGAQVTAQVVASGATVTLTPTVPLQRATQYTVTVYGVRDRNGNAMQTAYTSTFTTTAGRFASPVRLPTGQSPIEAVAVGDVNNDGRPDVLLATGFYFDAENDFRLFVFTQQPDGTLAAPVKYATGMGYSARGTSLAVADLDGDGRNDVVIGEGDGGVEVFLQSGTGALASAYRLDDTPAGKLRVADVDGDGHPDIVSLGAFTPAVQVRRQLPDRSFGAAESYPVEHGGWLDLDVGDVNGDGRPDIVVGTWGSNAATALAVLLQQGDGTFGPAQYRMVDPVWGTGGIAVGDVNGDGRNDVVASHGGNSITYIGIFRQDAAGDLAAIDRVSTYDIPSAVEIADMDGDGRSDIVAAHDGWAAVSLYRQRADGTLMPEERFPAPYGNVQAHALVLSDINGDGLRDILIGGSVLYQNTTVGPVAARTSPAGLPRFGRFTKPAARPRVPTR